MSKFGSPLNISNNLVWALTGTLIGLSLPSKFKASVFSQMDNTLPGVNK